MPIIWNQWLLPSDTAQYQLFNSLLWGKAAHVYECPRWSLNQTVFILLISCNTNWAIWIPVVLLIFWSSLCRIIVDIQVHTMWELQLLIIAKRCSFFFKLKVERYDMEISQNHNIRAENGNRINQLFWFVLISINMKCIGNSAKNQLQVADQLFILMSAKAMNFRYILKT